MGTEALIERAEAIAALYHDDPTTCRALRSSVEKLAAALRAAEAETQHIGELHAVLVEDCEREHIRAVQAEADLAAARAEAAEWKRHYDKATERLAAYSRDFVAEHNSLTAARAEIERLREGLRWIVGHDSRIDATIQSDGKDRRIVYGEFARIAVSLLGEQGK